MKCRFCGDYFSFELAFSNLFRIDPICRKCWKLRDKDLLFECIPYQGGVIEYYYHSDAEFIDSSLDDIYGNMIDKPLHLAISQQNRSELVLFVGKEEFVDFPHWSFILFSFQKVMFVSTFRYDFERMTMFY